MITKKRTYSKVECWSQGFSFSGHLERPTQTHNYNLFIIEKTYKYKSGGFLSLHMSSSFVTSTALRGINGTECSVFSFSRYSRNWSQEI